MSDYDIVNSTMNSCNCNASICDKHVCTDYGGCTIGCKDKDYLKPWCNQTIANYAASLLPHQEHYDEPDSLSNTHRNLIVYILSSVIGLAIVIFGILLLGIELHHNKSKVV